jgi:DnaJ C terminal domain
MSLSVARWRGCVLALTILPASIRRSGDNLVMRMELELVEALCGFQKVIRTLDDRDLIITAIPGEVMKHGDVKCVLNEGMPQYRNPFEKGRLIIQFQVNFPQSLPMEIIPQLESLLPPRYMKHVVVSLFMLLNFVLFQAGIHYFGSSRRGGPYGIQC